jgi:hypothetical protein
MPRRIIPNKLDRIWLDFISGLIGRANSREPAIHSRGTHVLYAHGEIDAKKKARF